MSHHAPDMEAPAIYVEAPPEDEHEDLIESTYPSSLNSGFHNNNHSNPEVQALWNQVYNQSPPSSSTIGPEQGLFSATFDQSTGQVPPLIISGLRDGSAGNVFLSPNDQSSPVDGAWSPGSTSEGDAFPDNFSESSSNWSPSVQSSSPSSPSLSPLNTSFNNIILSDDNVQGPAFYRHRSNSYTGLQETQNNMDLRPRSPSFTDVASLDEQYQGQPVPDFMLNEYNVSAQSYSPQQAPQISQWSTTVQNENNTSPVDAAYDPNTFVPSFDVSQWNPASVPNFADSQPIYSPPAGPPPSHGSHGRSLSTHLTVPVPSLQRRDAHRRSQSHTGIQQDSVRGRRYSPVSSPSSRHSSQSRDPSPASLSLDFPYLNFGPSAQTTQTDSNNPSFSPAGSPQPDFLSPTSTSPSTSPASLHSPSEFLSPTSPLTSSPRSAADGFLSPGLSSSGSSSQSLVNSAITIQGQDSEPELVTLPYSGGVARRHSFGGSRSRSASRSTSPFPTEPSSSSSLDSETTSTAATHLHRAASDPTGELRRKPRAPTVPRKYPGLLKPAKEVDEAGSSYANSVMIVEGVHSAPAPQEFKTVVGSDKIVQASNLRRKNEAKFKCDICDHKFTAKHNLMNHMNSHSNTRPHECIKCGNSFTTRGTHARHQAICSGRAVRKRY